MKALLFGGLVLLCAHFTHATQFSVGTDYLTFYSSDNRFDNPLSEKIKNEYKIEDSVWVTLNGSHKFSENLHGFLNISSRQEDASNNLKMLASLTSKDWSFRTRRGQFVGEFAQYEANGTRLHQVEEVNTEYFSIDAQYGWFGIRYLDMAAPTVLEYPPVTSISSGSVTTTTGDGLDPDFDLTAYEVFISYDGFQKALTKNHVNTDWYFTGRVFYGIGFGQGTISDEGRANFESASGETLADNKLSITVIELETKISYTKDFRLAADTKASLALGYGLNILAYDGEDDGSFESLSVSQAIFHYGPSITLGMNY